MRRGTTLALVAGGTLAVVAGAALARARLRRGGPAILAEATVPAPV